MSILRAWQRGQALVEALVLLPLLILSCMAVAWLGQLLFIAQAAGVASRSAMRVGSGRIGSAEPIRIRSVPRPCQTSTWGKAVRKARRIRPTVSSSVS